MVPKRKFNSRMKNIKLKLIAVKMMMEMLVPYWIYSCQLNHAYILVCQHFPFVQDEHGLSTHEKERLKIHAKIEQMERANLEPSTWTMQGEVIY